MAEGTTLAPWGKLGRKAIRWKKSQLGPYCFIFLRKKQNFVLSLFRGLHMASATSFLLQNVAFLVWAPIQANVQEQQVEFPFDRNWGQLLRKAQCGR